MSNNHGSGHLDALERIADENLQRDAEQAAGRTHRAALVEALAALRQRNGQALLLMEHLRRFVPLATMPAEIFALVNDVRVSLRLVPLGRDGTPAVDNYSTRVGETFASPPGGYPSGSAQPGAQKETP